MNKQTIFGMFLLCGFVLGMKIADAGPPSEPTPQEVNEFIRDLGSKDHLVAAGTRDRLNQMLGSSSSETSNPLKARHIFIACWNSGDAMVRNRLVPHVSDPRLNLPPDLRKQMYMELLTGLNFDPASWSAGSAFVGVKLNEDEYRAILEALDRTNTSATSEMKCDPSAIPEWILAATAARGSEAYPFLKEYARQNPGFSTRMGGSWLFILLASKHPDALDEAMTEIRTRDHAKRGDATAYLGPLASWVKLAVKSRPNDVKAQQYMVETMAILSSLVTDSDVKLPARMAHMGSLCEIAEVSTSTLVVLNEFLQQTDSFWIEALESENKHIREHGLILLERAKPPDMLRRLKKFVLYESDNRLKKRALDDLSKVPGSESAATIQEILTQCEDEAFKLHIQRACQNQEARTRQALRKTGTISVKP